MKWFQDNLLGTVLAGIGGVFIVLSMILTIVWTLPVSGGDVGSEVQQTSSVGPVVMAHQVGALDEYLVINQKPVFNENRQPVLDEDVDGEGDAAANNSIAVKDAPDVILTGVVITPDKRIASLKPVQGDQQNVMALEGQPLTGEFVGWQVSSIKPRSVVLESRNGDKLNLELEIHDVKIKAPPKPVAPVKTAQAEPAPPDTLIDQDGQPLSRAEQIRQRIAERREELRREQEDQQTQTQVQRRGSTAGQAAKPMDYQSAIRALMNKKSKDKTSNDNSDE